MADELPADIEFTADTWQLWLEIRDENDIELRITSKKKHVWCEHYRLLRIFIATYGYVPMHIDVIFRGLRLGAWVRTQQRRHILGLLSILRITCLELLPFWAWQASYWNSLMHALHDYIAKTNELPPSYCNKYRSYDIGGFVANMRVRRPELSDECRQALERVPHWTWQ
jgi:hypothetical protein